MTDTTNDIPQPEISNPPEIPSGDCGAMPCSRLLAPSDAPKNGTVILGHFGWPSFVPTFWCRHLEEWVTAQPEACAPGEMQFFESDTEIHTQMRGWIPIPNLPENDLAHLRAKKESH